MIIVVDLDKTLLSVDSFKAWVFYVLRHALISNPLLFLHTFGLTFLRAMKLISHHSFKQKLMILLDKNDWSEIFAKKISKHINWDVVDRLDKYRDDASFILSTAAPNHYVQHLVQYLPLQFKNVFASSIIDDKLIDNMGEVKVKNFRENYPSEVCDLFITDHHGDLPMMRLSSRVILVQPSKTTIDMVKNAGINVDLA